jgi:hypothetical protein
MKRLLTISAQRNAKKLTVVNTMQLGDFPSKNDASQTLIVAQDDYLAKIKQSELAPLMPQNVRWTSSDRRSYLIEEAPGYKTIRFRYGAKGAGEKMETLALPMPWLYYGISPDKNKQPYVSHLWCSYQQISYENNLLYTLPIPNVFKTGAICTHSLADQPSDLPYHLLVNNAIMEFWDSIFNYDVNHYGAMDLYIHLKYAGVERGYRDTFKYWSTLTPEQFLALDKRYWRKALTLETLGETMLAFNDFYSFSADQAGLLMSQLLVSAMEMQ